MVRLIAPAEMRDARRWWQVCLRMARLTCPHEENPCATCVLRVHEQGGRYDFVATVTWSMWVAQRANTYENEPGDLAWWEGVATARLLLPGLRTIANRDRHWLDEMPP